MSVKENPDREKQVKLCGVGARKRKKRALFVPFILSEGSFFNICVLIPMFGVLNALSEYTYFYISKK